MPAAVALQEPARLLQQLFYVILLQTSAYVQQILQFILFYCTERKLHKSTGQTYSLNQQL